MKPYHRQTSGEGEFLGAAAPPPENRELTAAPRAFGAPPEGPAQSPDIPVLKEKEKERKGSGVPWYGGSTAGTPGMTLGGLSGSAQVGASLSRAGFLGSGRIAAALANLFGGPGTFLGGLFASEFGANLVLAGMMAWGAVIAFAGYTLWNGLGKAESAALPSFPSLDGVGPSGIMIDKPKDRSLDYVGKANQGEVVWDKENPMAPKEAPKDEPKKAPEAKPEPPKTPQFQMPTLNELAKQKGLDPNGFVKKLTSDPSSLNGGAGGGPKLKDGQSGFNLTKTFTPAGVGARQKLQPLKRAMDNHGVRSGAAQKASSTRAMGQLKFATDQSRTGSYSAQSDPAKQAETNAFEQGKPVGGDALGITDPGGVVVPPGNGFTTPDIPSVPLGTNVTPYQQNVDNAKKAGSSAGALLAAGMIMIMMGLAMIMAGIGMLNCTTFPIGLAMIAAGMMMVMIGMMLLAMAAMMAMMGNQQAQQVGQPYGQQQQGQTASDCVNQAHMSGQSVDQVCPGGQAPMDTSMGNNVQQATANESQSTYHITGQ